MQSSALRQGGREDEWEESIVIQRVGPGDLEQCLEVIRRSFQTVADDFGLTRENCPGHTAYLGLDRLVRDYEFGNPMYLYLLDGRAVGFVSLRPREDASCEMKQLAVLPECRHLGIGRALVGHIRRVAADEYGADRLTIGIMEEDRALKAWYERLGFAPTGTERFEHLPFTVGFLEMPLAPSAR